MAIPNPSVGSTTAPRPVTPSWGMGDAIAGWLIAFVTAALFGGLLLSASGYESGATNIPLWLTTISNVPLWMGFVLIPIWVAAIKGNGWITDFHVAIKASDVPLGIAAGVAAQFILVPLISWPTLELTNTSVAELEKPARELADKANGVGGALLFILLVGLLAPVAEELFFRGLVLRSLEKRWNKWWALGISSVVFGATHFEPLQFAALTAAGAVFGYLVIRTDRLGPAIVAHTAFNLSTVTVLLWPK